ncbi:MAG: 50S ribosomal protein L32e [Candidatus Aenigmarchaeota archaeon]|nr:50S ribosomal protein L32e [Candidatus Aenigmarchaeota archaeon]
MARRRKIPKFKRQQWYLKKLKGKGWRKPKGIHSKQRHKIKGVRSSMPAIGYRQPKALRHKGKAGMIGVLVHNPEEAGKIDPKNQRAIIASSVGRRKRLEILKKAEEMKLKVANPKL